MLYLRRVVGNSMLPNYSEGQLVLFIRYVNPRVGDVVLLEHQGIEKMKRVGGLDDGNRLLVLGDNPSASTDSRAFGPIERSSIKGIAVFGRRSRSK